MSENQHSLPIWLATLTFDPLEKLPDILEVEQIQKTVPTPMFLKFKKRLTCRTAGLATSAENPTR